MIKALYDWDPDDPEDPDDTGHGYVLDPLLAVTETLECSISGEVDKAISPSQLIFEVIYYHVLYRDNIDYSLPGAIEQIFRDPIAQTELARQQRDLDEIAAACQEPGGLLALIPTLRARAIAEGIMFELK